MVNQIEDKIANTAIELDQKGYWTLITHYKDGEVVALIDYGPYYPKRSFKEKKIGTIKFYNDGSIVRVTHV